MMSDQPVDRHTQKAAEIFKVPPEQVTPEQRQYAKCVNMASDYLAPADLPAFMKGLKKP